MSLIEIVSIEQNVLPSLVRYCESKYRSWPIVLIADPNTAAAAGAGAAAALQDSGFSLTSIVLNGDHIHADEISLARALTRSPIGRALFLAVGSGTITDITRYVSFRLGMPFVSVPTAASVDGFASPGAPLVIEGVKRSYSSQPPVAIFADIGTLRAAPAELTAAGFGDMLGKLTAAADWKLGALLWNEPYDQAIAERSVAAAQACIESVEQIAVRSEAGMRRLIEALIESGRCMLDFGESRPASGAEHHISHLWEMLALLNGGPTALHGAQVGVAVILVAELYHAIRSIKRDEAARRIGATPIADRRTQIARIESAYGRLADTIVRDHAQFLDLSAQRQSDLARTVIDEWQQIRAVARSVPEPHYFRDLLLRVGGPVSASQLGLSAAQARTGFMFGHYLRERFTVVKLARMLGLHAVRG